jgi:mannitol-1-phosphate 5-dehydrogenase
VFNRPTYAGFGFGPIQAGLFALEACRSGAFGRLVIAEVDPALVTAVRAAGGRFTVNVAHAERVEAVSVGPVEILDPGVEEDRKRLLDAVAEASEIATAVPSTSFYASESPGSIHRLLARGLERRAGAPSVIYAAENHNRAAELLEEAVLGEVDPRRREDVRQASRFINTVIGKMSRAVIDPIEVEARGLRTMVPGSPRAFLVEAFHHILVAKPRFPPQMPFQRRLTVFVEKDDLLPFEEAKLYGHNAVHALAAYLAGRRGLERLEELSAIPGAVAFLRGALRDEAGAALIHRHRGVDPLFTPEGFAAHAEDLIGRMLNPFLGDPVERVARDPARKLGWNDRFAGALRLALAAGIEPRRLAAGAAAALVYWRPALGEGGRAAPLLTELWREAGPDPLEAAAVAERIEGGLEKLRRDPRESVFEI